MEVKHGNVQKHLRMVTEACVEFLNKETIVTCGLNGVDYSFDGGKNFYSISKEGFHVCRYARLGNTVYLAGGNGKIGKLVWPD
jgi:hypothetical protein